MLVDNKSDTVIKVTA